MIRNNGEAVSPVVGVMLMLVVTIIIAAVVSAFAGGMGGEQKKTPQVSLEAKSVIQGIKDTDTTNSVPDYSGWTAANGIVFENIGGDAFSLNDIAIQLLTPSKTQYTITTADQIDWSTTCLPAGSTTGYFHKIGNTTVNDNTIAPGDKFMFYADGCYDNSGSTSSSKGQYLIWYPKGASAKFPVQLGNKIGFKVIDRPSGRIISSGEAYFK